MFANARLFVLAGTLMVVSSCSKSNYWPNEVGDQTELLNSKNRKLGVRPDVVFYDTVGTEVYGVRRLGDAVSTQLGYWARCQLFRADNERVTYLNESETSTATRNPSYAAALTFAQGHCLNFGATPVAIAKDLTCYSEIGPEASQRLVKECIAVSPATHPPCNVQNSCAVIRNEIERSCRMLPAGDQTELCAR